MEDDSNGGSDDFHILVRLKVTGEFLIDIYGDTEADDDKPLRSIEALARDYFSDVLKEQVLERFEIEESFEMGFTGPVNPRKRR